MDQREDSFFHADKENYKKPDNENYFSVTEGIVITQQINFNQSESLLLGKLFLVLTLSLSLTESTQKVINETSRNVEIRFSILVKEIRLNIHSIPPQYLII